RSCRYDFFSLLIRPLPFALLFPYTTLFRSLVTSGADGVLEFVNCLRVEQMILAIITPLVLAARFENMSIGRAIGESALVSIEHRSEEHTSELQSRVDIVCRLLLEKKKYYYG